jgi:hypothetical protein
MGCDNKKFDRSRTEKDIGFSELRAMQCGNVDFMNLMKARGKTL